MRKFCPLIKEECRSSECILWHDSNEECLLVEGLYAYLLVADEKIWPDTELEEEERESNVPEEITKAAPEDLASELVSFVKSSFPEEEAPQVKDVAHIFWQQKQLVSEDIPLIILSRMQEVERLAQRQLDREREKSRVPSLVESLVHWARKHNLRSITWADVDAWLFETDEELSEQTRRTLYGIANLKMKSRATNATLPLWP